MSAVNDHQGEKVSADPSFLECHKLLKSMEETDSPASTPASAPNGHCSSDDEKSNKETDISLKPASKDGKNSEQINCISESKTTSEKSGEELPKTNGLNGVGDSQKAQSNGSNTEMSGDMKESNEETTAKNVNTSSENAKTTGNNVNTSGGDADTTGKNVNMSGAVSETIVKKDLNVPVVDAKTGDRKIEDSGTDSALSEEDGKKTDDKKGNSVPSSRNSEVNKTQSADSTAVSDKSAPEQSIKPTASESTNRQSAPASTQPPIQSANSLPKPIAPKEENKPATVQGTSVGTKPPLPTPELQQQLQNKPKTSTPRGKYKKKDNSNIASAKKIPKEMGPTATFLCDLGLDLVKEGVYKDLISIQSRKKKANKLSEAEEKQLEKLKDNYDNVYEKNKDVRVDYNMKCGKCKFVTESKNVMWLHHESPHTDDREDLFCCHCDFVTRIPVSFTYHMEAEHQMKGRIIPKAAFWNCSTCTFETNNKGNLTKHKWKCEKGFDYKTNLCPTSSHVNYCLAYNFYKTPKPEAPKEVIVRPPPRPTPQRPPLRPTAPQRTMLTPAFHSINQNRMLAPHVFRPGVPNQMRMQMVLQPQHTLVRNTRPQQYQFVQHRPATTVRQMISSQFQRPAQNIVRAGQNIIRPQQSMVRPPQPDLGLVSCEICKGFVKDKDALRVHFYFAHQIDLPANLLKRAQPPLFCEVCLERFWTSQGLQKHKETNKHFAKTRMHICIICGNHVNHLLTHMSSVHNLSLKDFLIAKRCIVCGGSFQNRPSLEIHLASTHGILVRTSNQTQGPQQQNTVVNAKQPIIQQQQQQQQPQQQQPLLYMHMSVLRTKTTVACSICTISFLNNDLLVKHCQHCHVTCVNCGIVFADQLNKNRHACSMSYTTWPRSCLVCGAKVISKNMKAHVQLNHIKKEIKVSIKRTRQAENLAEEIVKRRRLAAERVIDIDDDSCEGGKDIDKGSETKTPVKTEEKTNVTKPVESSNKDSNVATDASNEKVQDVTVADKNSSSNVKAQNAADKDISDAVEQSEPKPKTETEKVEKENEPKVSPKPSTDSEAENSLPPSDKLSVSETVKECKSDEADNDVKQTDAADNDLEQTDAAGNDVKQTKAADNDLKQTEAADNDVKQTDAADNDLKQTDAADNDLKQTDAADNDTKQTEEEPMDTSDQS